MKAEVKTEFKWYLFAADHHGQWQELVRRLKLKLNGGNLQHDRAKALY